MNHYFTMSMILKETYIFILRLDFTENKGIFYPTEGAFGHAGSQEETNTVYGAQWTKGVGGCNLVRWNMKENHVETFGYVSDAMSYQFELTKDGKIVAFNVYGFFYKIDPATGAVETSKMFDTDSVGHVDCLCRIDENRLLGTPFITQRFFEMNIRENKGLDMGRATGGVGEVLAVIPFKDKIYMASYTQGYMTEYDPKLPARFPENPRSVVEPPAPAMRPVGYCTDHDSVYYSCSHEYGFLGSMTIKYTPESGKTVFLDNPLEHHMIVPCSTIPVRIRNRVTYDAIAEAVLRGDNSYIVNSILPPQSDGQGVCPVKTVTTEIKV